MPMTDVAEFIRARLVEDEVTARAATDGPWRYTPDKEWFTDEDKMRAARAGVPQSGGEEFVGAGPTDSTIGVAATGPAGSTQAMCDADHIARHDPARVLAQVAAMRAVVDRYEKLDHESDRSDGLADLAARVAAAAAARDAVRHLAAIWRDHGDYDPAWSPTAA